MAISRRKKAQREEMLKKQAAERKRKALFTVKREKKEFVEYKPERAYVRETPDYPSFDSKAPAVAAKKETNEYSGDYITGIATMHKSNLVPVGKGDSPESYAQMRR